jgi:hypothetical protein
VRSRVLVGIFGTLSLHPKIPFPAAGLEREVRSRLFTIYMIPVSFLDNILRPLVMARGLDTPMLIILIGVIGGTISYGITGLFLGPIVLAVIWELLVAWVRERESA